MARKQEKDEDKLLQSSPDLLKKKSVEEQNPVIEENFVIPKGNFISYTWNGGHDPPIETPSIETSDATQQLEVHEDMRRLQLHVKRNPTNPDVRQYYLDLFPRLTYEE
jgi:hypothetical protein